MPCMGSWFRTVIQIRELFKRFLQAASIACYAEPCISYDRDVGLSVRPSVRLSVCPCVSHTLTLSENDAS